MDELSVTITEKLDDKIIAVYGKLTYGELTINRSTERVKKFYDMAKDKEQYRKLFRMETLEKLIEDYRKIEYP